MGLFGGILKVAGSIFGGGKGRSRRQAERAARRAERAEKERMERQREHEYQLELARASALKSNNSGSPGSSSGGMSKNMPYILGAVALGAIVMLQKK